MSHVQCSICGGDQSTVKGSRPAGEINGHPSIRRRRECKACKARFTTFEVNIEAFGALLTLEQMQAGRGQACEDALVSALDALRALRKGGGAEKPPRIRIDQQVDNFIRNGAT